jgi:lipoate-protein ligase A
MEHATDQPPRAEPSSDASEIGEWRLLRDAPAPGGWNMAVDEVLLEWSGRTGQCGWRFYRWSEPTLSLGYFQEYSDRQLHPASLQAPLVRRASGGGAIVHDRELTYSLAVPLTHPLGRRRLDLYRTVHAGLVELLAERGIVARMWSDETTSGRPQPFLCFERRSPGDVVVGTGKVAGSAQRRSAAAVLQHGSILLQRSPTAPELAGLSELSGEPIEPEWLEQMWLPRLAAALQARWRADSLSDEEAAAAERILAEKYGSLGWNRHRNRG